MNKKELKALMKPLVRECIQEVLLQEGVLSTIISEVVKGTSGMVEPPSRQEKIRKSTERVNNDHGSAMARLQEQKRRANQDRKDLLDAIGNDAYNGVNLFEGTEPLRRGGAAGKSDAPQGALSSYAPDDSGVDISGLLNLAGGEWKKLE